MENTALLTTAAFLGFFHTLIGPDHYVPFVAISKAKGWSLTKTLRITGICGFGHVASSVLIGFVGVAFGTALQKLELIESFRGDGAAYLLFAFGLTYTVWGLWKAFKGKEHSHPHVHEDGTVHTHKHSHHQSHAHVHTKKGIVATWSLFLIFVFGPCEVLIPLVMYPAAQASYTLLISVTLLFSFATVATMLTAVTLSHFGLQKVRTSFFNRFADAIAGVSITLCAVLIFVGL